MLVPFGFFKKKENEAPVQHPAVAAPAAGAISIHQAQDLLHSIESAMVQELAARLTSLKQSASLSLQSIGTLANDMEHEKLKLEGLEQRYKSVAENTKRTIISSLRREAATELPQVQTANDVRKFKERFESMMNRFGEVSGSHSKVINAFMKKHASRMKEEFEALTEILNETRTAISDFDQRRAPIVKCNGILNTASQKISSIRASEASVQNIEREVKRVQTELESLKNELETLRASPEFSQVQAMVQKALDVETQVEQFHSQLTDLFSHVSRAFTKYSYGLTKETEARLQMMSGEPWKMFDEADISPYFILLQDIRKSIDSGNIQLKDFDKVLQYLDIIISSLPELQGKAQALKVQADALRQGNSNLVDRASELEDKIVQHEEEVAKGRQEAEQQRRQIAEKSGELAFQLKEASSILEELAGQKYVLEY